ncbi:hypothetical protein [Candidatus Odyssella acanthamoebae]|uniref:Uncharacterized protein n=1 Tax=Candidatus Odyssella acanthamoebae TaxID=91604 RepID=A0A077B0U9_9PROT|nr:hypothetical protein [Candidatus Paracaedibacter acanthamoebae]AIK96560.1 hypothetical protein ID47_07165 [Candidatus Paracaedibacter acanthamoebae]
MTIKKLRQFFWEVCFYLCAFILFTEALEDIKFVDIDQFKFATTQKSGLRICVFNLKAQQYETINYYNLPATKDRKPEGELLKDFEGLRVAYNGDVILSSPLKGMVIRTNGRIQTEQEDFRIHVDDQERNIAYPGLPPFSANKLKTHLNEQFGKGPHRQTSFNITTCTLPSGTSTTVTLDNISSDERENKVERGIIGELATRMTLFCCGFYEKIPSQDKCNQGIDGVYFQQDGKEGEVEALFLTESKCQNASRSPLKIMTTQLTEKILYENIGRLDPVYKERVLNFIESFPKKVYKGTHRILKSGKSQWLVQPLDTKAFKAQGLGVFSPEKEKKVFIANIASKFNSPEELLRVVFEYYELESEEEKLVVFQRALSCSPEHLLLLMEACKQQEQKPEEQRSRRNQAAEQKTPGNQTPVEESILEKQILHEAQKKPVARRISFSLPDIHVKEEVKVEYSRENLSTLLTYIKNGFKRAALKEINAGLKRVDPNTVLLGPSELAMLSNYTHYSDYNKKRDRKPLWDLLLQAFPDQYQQTIADGLYNVNPSS